MKRKINSYIICILVIITTLLTTATHANENKTVNQEKLNNFTEKILEIREPYDRSHENIKLTKKKARKYSGWIIMYAAEQGIPPELLFALCWQENHFVNKTGDPAPNVTAYGLCQLTPTAANRVSQDRITHTNAREELVLKPKNNFKLAARYLTLRIRNNDNRYFSGIGAYNAGINGDRNAYYVKNVLDKYCELADCKDNWFIPRMH